MSYQITKVYKSKAGTITAYYTSQRVEKAYACAQPDGTYWTKNPTTSNFQACVVMLRNTSHAYLRSIPDHTKVDNLDDLPVIWEP